MAKKGIILNKSKEFITDNIELLKEYESERYNKNIGYKVNNTSIDINNTAAFTQCGSNLNIFLDKFIKKAIDEKSEEIIKRAYELEEIEYQKIKKEAEKEARKILNKNQ